MSTKTIKLTDEQGNLMLPESCENGNGYVKFADGTLICFGITGLMPSQTTQKSDVVTGMHRFYGANIQNFAQQFIAVPQLTASIRQNTSSAYMVSEAIATATSFGLEIWTNQTTWGSLDISYIAIGKWK